MKIRIGIVDDHQLFLKSLGFLISSLPNFELMVDAMNGEDLLEKLRNGLTGYSADRRQYAAD